MITITPCSRTIPFVLVPARGVLFLIIVVYLVGGTTLLLPKADAFTIVGTQPQRRIPSCTDISSPIPLSSSRPLFHEKNICLFAKSSSKRSGAASRRSSSGNSNTTKNGSNSGGGGGGGGTGFAKQPSEKVIQEQEIDHDKSGMVRQDAYGIYSKPALYDLAFGYRNYEEEVKFLLDAHDKYSQITTSDGRDKTDNGINIIELAAGPARHGITALKFFQKRVNSCTAVDISIEMMEYSKEVADEELGDAGYGGLRDQFHYVMDDIRSLSESKSAVFKPQSFDSAWLLLGSMQHLTHNDDVISCFSSASNLLRQGGTLIIELPHPRETFTMVECTRNGWKVPLEDEVGEEYGELKIVWGDDSDAFDPIRQVRDFTVIMELTVKEDAKNDDDESFDDLESIKEIVPMRLFTFQEIDAMARIGGFHVEGLYGALSDDVDVHDEDGAFRLVCVLRKISSPMKF
eukprot:CAMPEP_0176481006 /NCGR_PEP_ID=MMETSP0200_2-20121128/2582_1 /TAXON_ID=947934 /ORGANISM="Chaetoceros sp., Strain GSL56" /LENGTH=458 /DNA_ID=CAMNT_0017877167 /DNA_START=25 /DNA_END=1401 /DNA_ORIENTATION=-